MSGTDIAPPAMAAVNINNECVGGQTGSLAPVIAGGAEAASTSKQSGAPEPAVTGEPLDPAPAGIARDSCPAPAGASRDSCPESDGGCIEMSSGDEDSGGVFTMAQGIKRGRQKSSVSPVYNTIKPNLKVLITPIEKSKSLRNVNPIIIQKEINTNVVTVKSVTKQGRAIIAVCFNEKQASKLLDLTQFSTFDVKTESYTPFEGSKGVIKGVDVDISDRDLQNALDHFGVMSIKRINTRRNGSLVPTTTVILNFRTKKIPTEVFLGYEKKKVVEYIPKVNRCFKCQRFGHSSYMCNSTVRCPTCGERHGWDHCPNKENPHCTNCGGRHSAAYLGCPKYKDAQKIQEIKTKEKNPQLCRCLKKVSKHK